MAASKDKAASAAEEQFEQGYFGAKVDPTPDENYTVAGVTSGKATPETDEKAAQKASAEASAARSRFTEK